MSERRVKLIWRGWHHGYPRPQYLRWRFWAIQRWDFGGYRHLAIGPVVLVLP